MRGFIGVGISLWALAAAMPAMAQDKKDGDQQDSTITVTATRIPTDVKDVPATVTVIDEKKIADQLVTDIKDLVRYEPGISVPRGPTRFGAALGVTGRAGNEGFIVRGIGGNRVLIQVDGVRVPDGFTFGAQSSGRDYVDIGLVKSVEILRGPASALYGSDGLAGAISFTTSDPADFLTGGKKFGGLVRAGYSSADDEFAETGILAGRFGDLSAMISYTRRDFHELDNKGTVGGTGAARTEPNPQDGRSNAVLGRIVYEPDASNRFRLTGEYQDSHVYTDVLTGLSSTVELLQARDSTKRGRIAGDWFWKGEGLFDHARISVYWQDGENRQFTDEDRTPAADRERLNTFENTVFGGSVEVGARFDTGAITHRLLFGGDISKTHQEGLRDGVVPPAGETFPTRAFPETNYTLAGAFIADEIAIGPITLYPALRFDAYDLSPEADPLLPAFTAAKQSGSRVSPKLGAVLKLSDEIRFFANYAQGFKAPEPSQVNQFFSNIAFGYTSRPNPNLRPETSESWEGGFRLNSGPVGLNVTGFVSNYDDFISQEVTSGSFTPADPAIYQFINLDKVKVKGAEATFTVTGSNGLFGKLGLSYAKGDVIDPSGARSPLSTVDPLKLILGLGYRANDGRFGGDVTATHSAQKELSATTGVCSGTCFTPGAFTVLDATAFFRLTQGLTLRAGVFNIFDTKYAWWNDVRGLANSSTVKDSYTQPGRNGSVSVSYRF
ncbi:TonB-dependent hemoglobin/transferrin/lactoferrin family receptor [Sphingomonas sp. HITSZ_GF]|uniref:TonB-dependent hemoglobin/transferrin/lactoferrin family receptor n=1 Tax=Sphingomonas sp. HITSZ_GF TaxID=3037247 RepID=UPI00240D99E3|nr:TonB-dependent hemoglobin/transferrin/lactoferrin family receptor [Sphingomonas sp. HITSZ_GF]MDG2534563.1 TonB-dependent hemoglobin/transferrin/lactoferrin family receptor [Sphingomonas sp. HITSZ_GF]